MSEIHGLLEAFFETGTEGVIWSVYDESLIAEDGMRTYEGLHALGQKDFLRIFNDSARTEILWEGTVDLEYETNQYPRSIHNDYKQQAVSGFWVHGLQRDMDPEKWSDMFFDEKPCTLIPFIGPVAP